MQGAVKILIRKHHALATIGGVRRVGQEDGAVVRQVLIGFLVVQHIVQHVGQERGTRLVRQQHRRQVGRFQNGLAEEIRFQFAAQQRPIRLLAMQCIVAARDGAARHAGDGRSTTDEAELFQLLQRGGREIGCAAAPAGQRDADEVVVGHGILDARLGRVDAQARSFLHGEHAVFDAAVGAQGEYRAAAQQRNEDTWCKQAWIHA
ncbi:hypothetical protein D3C81_1534270 [compost metagenome]